MERHVPIFGLKINVTASRNELFRDGLMPFKSWAAALSGASAAAEQLIFMTSREHQTVDLTNRRSTFEKDTRPDMGMRPSRSGAY